VHQVGKKDYIVLRCMVNNTFKKTDRRVSLTDKREQKKYVSDIKIRNG
jgi:hypothetical protein